MNIEELNKKIEEQTVLLNKILDIQEKMYQLVNPNRTYCDKGNFDNKFNPLE